MGFGVGLGMVLTGTSWALCMAFSAFFRLLRPGSSQPQSSISTSSRRFAAGKKNRTQNIIWCNAWCSFQSVPPWSKTNKNMPKSIQHVSKMYPTDSKSINASCCWMICPICCIKKRGKGSTMLQQAVNKQLWNGKTDPQPSQVLQLSEDLQIHPRPHLFHQTQSRVQTQLKYS